MILMDWLLRNSSFCHRASVSQYFGLHSRFRGLLVPLLYTYTAISFVVPPLALQIRLMALRAELQYCNAP